MIESMETTILSRRQLTPVFGAEITGADLERMDDATFAKIEDGQRGRNHVI